MSDINQKLDNLKRSVAKFGNPYPPVGSIWVNNKTQKLYKILYAGVHTETGEPLVVYKGIGENAPADPDDVWCRPLSMWRDKFTLAVLEKLF